MKVVKLDRRHRLFHSGYAYAFVSDRFSKESNKIERAVTALEGYRWDRTFWGKRKSYGRPYYIGVKNESTLTMAILKGE
jgi:hypothetical protein